jgi:propanediol dehydratase large subunit
VGLCVPDGGCIVCLCLQRVSDDRGAGCDKLSDVDGISQHLGNTTAEILQRKFDESGFTTILDVVQASEDSADLTASSWMPPPIDSLMPSDIGFARALRDKATTLVQLGKAGAAATVKEQAKEYLLLVSDFCQPLLATVVLWR